MLIINISERPRVITEKEPSKEAKPSSAKTCGHTVAKREDTIMSLLPVQVKSIRGNKTIQTHEFLDPESTATFCSEHLMRRLDIAGRKTSFLLHTMGQEKVVSSCALDELEVAGLGSYNCYSLQKVLSQKKKMPVTTSNMVTRRCTFPVFMLRLTC